MDDVRVPTPWDTLVAWLGPPRDYQLTRWLILRLLGVVYVFAFLGLIMQWGPLLGSHGLTPVAREIDQARAAGASIVDVPTIFMFGASDSAFAVWAYAGLAIAVCVALGYANLPMMLALWVIYGSYVRIGGVWFAFGWETQILETTLLAAVLAHPWDPRPLAARPPPVTAIVLMRWLTFRMMLGAGLIKLRGDPCWSSLTCLDAHFETQPIPNPLSPLFHHAPHAVHATGVVFNHIVEIVAPWFVFGPRRLRLIAGLAMAAFQGVLILSGNLAFLNWLTLVPILACFDDAALYRALPARARAWLRARIADAPARDGRQLGIALAGALFVIVLWQPLFDSMTARHEVITAVGLAVIVTAALIVVHARRWRLDGHQIAVGCFAALVAVKSIDVVENLASKHQVMNKTFDRLELVNTYGAFGSVGDVRHELVIEGTMAADAGAPEADWRPYELPCKPGALARRPCLLGPYHRRLDWLIWFAAMPDEPSHAWIYHLVWKLLDGDPTVRELLAGDPFGGKPPRWVRIRRFVYHLARYRENPWWTRDSEELWLGPLSRESPELLGVLDRFGWR